MDDACETAKPQQDSSPRGGPKRSRMRRQGVPNPTFEPVKKTLGPELRLVCFIQRSNPIQTLLPHPRQRLPHPTFEPLRNPRGPSEHLKKGHFTHVLKKKFTSPFVFFESICLLKHFHIVNASGHKPSCKQK